MKKQILITVMVAFFMTAMSQVYIPPQDFGGETFPPEGWTTEDGGEEGTFEQGPMPSEEPPVMCTWVECSSNTLVNDRIISPEVLLPAGSEAKVHAMLRGSMGYTLAMYWDPDNEVRIFIEISTDGGANWTPILDLDDEASVIAAGTDWPWADWEWFDVAIDVSAYAGETVKIAFHYDKEYIPQGGGSFGITNFGLWEDTYNDSQLLNLNINDYDLVNTEVEVEGLMKNIGSNQITSFEGEVLINGELAENFSVTGINLDPFENYNFVAGNPIVFSDVDIYNVELIITKTNDVNDNSPDNNSLSKEISIASEVVARKPMFEMFTSSTCGPCVAANENLDALLSNNDDDSYSLIKYQVNWPGDGDPYYIEDNGIRVDYYSVGGAPNLYSNGNNVNTYINQSDFNEALNTEAYVDLSLDHIFDGLNLTAFITVDPKLNIEDASVYFAVVEKTTYNNTGTNSETEFHNVAMAIMPDGNGISTSLSAGVDNSFTASANLLFTFIEEFDDLMLISWVQDNDTKIILQSESHDLDIATEIEDEKAVDIAIFPNPNNGIFVVRGAEKTNMEIIDISGRLIYSESIFENLKAIDLSEFEAGIYFIKISTEDSVVTIEKLIIK